MSDKHPFYDLMEKFDTDMSELEKVALYGLMKTSSDPTWEHLTVEEVWARMLTEFDAWKAECHRESMGADKIADTPSPEAQKAHDENLLKSLPIPSKFKM